MRSADLFSRHARPTKWNIPKLTAQPKMWIYFHVRIKYIKRNGHIPVNGQIEKYSLDIKMNGSFHIECVVNLERE